MATKEKDKVETSEAIKKNPHSLDKYIKGSQLRNRWPGITQFEISRFVLEHRLPAFDIDLDRLIDPDNPEDRSRFKKWYFLNIYVDNLRFSLSDVVNFEKEYGLESNLERSKEITPSQNNIVEVESVRSLNAKERRGLGRLKQREKIWDKSIEATVVAMNFCHELGRCITRAELLDALKSFKLPDSTLTMIWKSIREHTDYTKGPGRPKNEL